MVRNCSRRGVDGEGANSFCCVQVSALQRSSLMSGVIPVWFGWDMNRVREAASVSGLEKSTWKFGEVSCTWKCS